MIPEEQPFGFTPAWFAIGVVTPSGLAELRTQWARGDDQHTEHYRWRAFQAFVREQRPLSAEMVAALYALGAGDPDRAMGESMMNALVRLPECPESVLNEAAGSGIAHLMRVVERRRAAI
jgi:hypothetical protein